MDESGSIEWGVSEQTLPIGQLQELKDTGERKEIVINQVASDGSI